MKLRIEIMGVFFAAVMLLTFSGVSKTFAAHELFNSLDENVDGNVNEEEFAEDMKERVFGKIDEDSNKEISRDEWMDIADVSENNKHANLFRMIDKNRDKRITFFEFSNYAEMHSNIHEAFMGLDKDGSNSLSPDEITLRPYFKMITIKLK